MLVNTLILEAFLITSKSHIYLNLDNTIKKLSRYCSFSAMKPVFDRHSNAGQKFQVTCGKGQELSDTRLYSTRGDIAASLGNGRTITFVCRIDGYVVWTSTGSGYKCEPYPKN